MFHFWKYVAGDTVSGTLIIVWNFMPAEARTSMTLSILMPLGKASSWQRRSASTSLATRWQQITTALLAPQWCCSGWWEICSTSARGGKRNSTLERWRKAGARMMDGSKFPETGKLIWWILFERTDLFFFYIHENGNWIEMRMGKLFLQHKESQRVLSNFSFKIFLCQFFWLWCCCLNKWLPHHTTKWSTSPLFTYCPPLIHPTSHCHFISE